MFRQQAAQQRRAALIRAALQAICVTAEYQTDKLAEQQNRSKQPINFFRIMISHGRR